MASAYVKCAIGAFYFDATISESHDLENTITSNPVQTGANVNDHVFQQPIMYTMQLFQSDCLTSIVKGQFEDKGKTRSQSAYNVLMALWQLAQILTIQTSLTTYKNMIIKSVVANKDKVTQNAIKATVVLQQLIITDANAVSISALQTTTVSTSTSTQNQVAGSTKKGTLSAKKVTDAVNQKIKSLFGWS